MNKLSTSSPLKPDPRLGLEAEIIRFYQRRRYLHRTSSEKMTSTFTTYPPNYDDSSVVDDISSLIRTALAVQEGLFNAKERLSRIDTTDVNGLLPRLINIDEVNLERFSCV